MNIPLELRLAIDLLRNMAPLLALIFVYSVFRPRLLGLPAVYRDLVTGILFGSFALLATPILVSPGIFINGRIIVIVTAGAFFGWRTVLPVTAIIIIDRLMLGGIGVPANLASVLTVTLSSSLLYQRFIAHGRAYRTTHLVWLGVAVAVQALLWTLLLLPADTALTTLSITAPPIMVVYPLATLLFGNALSTRAAPRRARRCAAPRA